MPSPRTLVLSVTTGAIVATAAAWGAVNRPNTAMRPSAIAEALPVNGEKTGGWGWLKSFIGSDSDTDQQAATEPAEAAPPPPEVKPAKPAVRRLGRSKTPGCDKRAGLSHFCTISKPADKTTADKAPADHGPADQGS